MTPRAVLLLLMLGASPSTTTAQIRISPFATGTFGLSDLRNRFSIQTSPPTTNFAATHSGNILAALSLGIAFGDHVSADASVRSSLGIRQPFRALTLGPAIRWGKGLQVYLRAGFGRVQGFEAVDCITSSSSCPPHHSEWSSGFDVSVGVDFRGDRRVGIGPVLWWAQSTGSDTQYRSVGVGIQFRYR